MTGNEETGRPLGAPRLQPPSAKGKPQGSAVTQTYPKRARVRLDEYERIGVHFITPYHPSLLSDLGRAMQREMWTWSGQEWKTDELGFFVVAKALIDRGFTLEVIGRFPASFLKGLPAGRIKTYRRAQ